MSKHLRFAAVSSLCLMMTLTSCTAFAAAKLTLSVPGKEVNGAAEYTITVNSNEPGFITMKLTQDGTHVATLLENEEIHTKNNEITLTALDDNGEPFAPGKYTVSAVMVDQFGVSSAEVSKNITFIEPAVVEEE